MRWLITGAAGMLGRELSARLQAAGAEVVALTRADLDLLDEPAVRRTVAACAPDVVANCAAWTAVDDAETAEEAALAINGRAVAVLAEICAARGIPLVQPSTDYVFPGTATAPYPEDAPTAPLNAYGRTKLAGERAVLAAGAGYVVRTAWLYGAHGPSFVRTMVRLSRERETLTVVDDQRGQPTWTGDLAERIIALVDSGAPFGVHHATNSGETTWYGLAREVFALLGEDPDRVRPTTSENFPRPAARPAYSVLAQDPARAPGLPPMRHWRKALHAAWPELIAAWS
ncbi:dTDP-4-dehydrorhamnose reductase [Thermomonospora sp. CIF 1]|uniref:dTDP-4-dehydrorhamnose reductase n=1 Tax=Thermomonospora sp. CIF 1 TaxID=1916083 RepID=UPI000CBF39AD|nr:MAG: dTDP-4-dehydrorhamnose reductase [Thermomonospora sp. CIF 1]